MAFVYKDLQDEVARRATRDQSGTQFTTAIKNIINTSLFRLSREANWRVLRRKNTFDTVTTYTTGSGGGTFTNGSKSITMVGATFLTDNIQPGRRIKLQGSSKLFVIKTITGETTLTIDINYDGTTVSGTGTYSILAQEEYNLPIQASHSMFMWHEDYGNPYMMNFVPEQTFYGAGINIEVESTPINYRMWGEDMVVEQLKEASVVTISSSSSSDTNISVTVFGTVSGYPDFESISTNASDGTTSVVGSKSFTDIDRIVKSSSSVGRITATANSTNTTVAVLPVGDTTAGILYRKVQLHPLPNKIMPIHVQYYKDPYRLVNDNDVHELGQEFDEAIILLSVSKINFESNKGEGEDFYRLYRDEVRSLRKTNTDKIDWFPKLGRSFRRRSNMVHENLAYTQVGAYYGPRS